MYNRYIPPPKGAAAAGAPQASAATPAISEPAIAQPKKIVFGDDDFPMPAPQKGKQETDNAPARVTETATPKKEKSKSEAQEDQEPQSELKDSSSKKRKRKSKGQEVADDQGVVEQDPEPPIVNAQQDDDTDAMDEDTKPRKEKKERNKKKKIKEGAVEADAAEEDTDNIRQRHKSVFEKVGKALKKAVDAAEEGAEGMDVDMDAAGLEEVHGLEPLPQPEPVVFDESKLTYETLPPWLASPVRVIGDTRRPFTEFGIKPESAKILEAKGFKDAFAVQTTVLPLLIPAADRQGDVVVAAPTGSGKTLAYVLPMVQDICKGRITKLRAVIVLPTRDLVQQVEAACEACLAAFSVQGKKVKVGTAIGNKAFKEEQALLMQEEQKYDPAGYEKYMERQMRFVNLEDSDGEDDELNLNISKPLPHHVITHVSKVDILICTPGRLVEHINKTPGFTLDYVRWLVVDEADKLLAQDFQQWLGAVMEKLSTEKMSARDFPESNKSGVRKVILSATMTRDISLLNGLRLSRPKLVVLEGNKSGEQSLPSLLKESVIKIRDPSLKPLYLVDLLNSKHLAAINPESPAEEDTKMISESKATCESEASSSSDSDSDSSSDLSSDSSSSDSDEETQPTKSKSQTKPKSSTKARNMDATVLVFTKSNEAALRLSRLLAILEPDLAPLIGTLTSSTKTSKRAQTLRAFAQGKLRILVASDLVSRGIDLMNLDHVINYDLPISETSYIHRVGRTARAGRAGHAWTMVEHAEARRFWRDFAGEGKGAVTNIIRSGTVQRVRVGGDETNGGKFCEERIKLYELALEQLRQEAGEGRK
ncbi:P-loop containing nucleoside triphosphate hydrolase protein [Podospora didyma]|uniref:ATP-dependent RNA helicase n=1 Tax=Podospora didyma TaxID=330526 RepID=A0AAE0NRY4_9PEZI|nr:P-loop containing nucleoside triphosphate hydrolase protein [Podospora didyma]